MATRQFADLSQYQKALAAPAVNPLDAAIQGLQQGVQLQQLPQTIQQGALEQEIQQAIQQAKLNQLQTGSVENVGGRLVRYNPQTGKVEVILDAAAQPTNFQFAGFDAKGNPISYDPRNNALTSPTVPAGLNVIGSLQPKTVAPETLSTVVSDQGLFKTGNRSTTATPLTIQGDQLTNTKPVPPANVRQITDANGFLFTQPLTGGSLTQVLNKDGTPFNAGVANRVFTSDQGVFSLPTKSEGAPTATPLTTSPQAGDAPGPQLTKTSSNPLSEKLAKDVQSNKAYQAFKVVNDATDGLQATLDYANSNPQDQTGIKSSAVDSFQKIINPGSVVRQTAFAQTTAGQALENKINNFINGLSTGQVVTPEQIQSMLNIAKKYQEGARKSAEEELSVIKNRGDKANISPEDYIPGLFRKSTSSTAPVRVNTKAERDALAPGTKYVGPDGLIATTPKKP